VRNGPVLGQTCTRIGDAELAPARPPATPPAGRRAELLAEKERLSKEIRRHLPVEEVLRVLALDSGNGATVIPDPSLAPDGVALRMRAWSPAAPDAFKPDIELLFTEYPDPGGVATYFRAAPRAAVEDDELSMPR
jgi:hypothetical protein